MGTLSPYLLVACQADPGRASQRFNCVPEHDWPEMPASPYTDRGRRTKEDRFIEDFPWFGGRPGPSATKFLAVWVTMLVLLVLGVIYAMVTLHICTAIGLFVLLVVIAVLPRLFLYGSRI